MGPQKWYRKGRTFNIFGHSFVGPCGSFYALRTSPGPEARPYIGRSRPPCEVVRENSSQRTSWPTSPVQRSTAIKTGSQRSSACWSAVTRLLVTFQRSTAIKTGSQRSSACWSLFSGRPLSRPICIYIDIYVGVSGRPLRQVLNNRTPWDNVIKVMASVRGSVALLPQAYRWSSRKQPPALWQPSARFT